MTMELVEGQTLAKMLPEGRLLAERAARDRHPARRCGERRPPQGHHPPRPQTGQHHGRRRGPAEGARLRPGQAAGTSTGLRRGRTRLRQPTVETEEGKILGTVAYMSPEQAEGKAVDPRSDIFSLGTMLYQMATGERPFQGDTSMSTIGSILKDDPLSGHRAQAVAAAAPGPHRPPLPGQGSRPALPDRARPAQRARGAQGGDRFGRARRRAGDGGPPTGSSFLRYVGLRAVAALIAVVAIRSARRETDESLHDPSMCRGPSPARSARKWTSTGRRSPCSWPIGLTRAGSVDVMVQPVAGGEAQLLAGGPGGRDLSALVAGRKVPRLRLELRERDPGVARSTPWRGSKETDRDQYPNPGPGQDRLYDGRPPVGGRRRESPGFPRRRLGANRDLPGRPRYGRCRTAELPDIGQRRSRPVALLRRRAASCFSAAAAARASC